MRRAGQFPLLLAVTALFAGCGESPTTVEPADEFLETLSVLTDASRAEPDKSAQTSVLDQLLHQAIAQAARQGGEDAVRRITAGLRQLIESAKRAHESGDPEAFRRIMDAVRTESARIVVAVLGAPAVHHAMSLVAEQMAGLGQLIAKAADAGKDVGPLRELARKAHQLQQAAAAAVEAGNPVAALRFAADAADVLRHVPGLAKGPASASLLDRLLHEAVAKVAKEQGKEAATTLTAGLKTLHVQARAAHQSGDEEALRKVMEAIRDETARIVVSVLGPQVAAAVTRDVQRQLERVVRHLEEAERQGRDVAHARRIASAAAHRLEAAVAALQQGNPVAALRLAAEAADTLGRL